METPPSAPLLRPARSGLPVAASNERLGGTPTAGEVLESRTVVRINHVAIAISCIALGLCALLGMLLLRQVKSSAELARAKEAADHIRTQLQQLRSGKMTLCNDSRRAITVEAVTVFYLDKTGAFRSFSSSAEAKGNQWPKWEIRSSGSQQLEFVKGAEVIWDGSVVFYSILASYFDDRSEHEWILSGLWKDVGGNCLKLNLDDH